jgi:hypothetical protein
MNFYPAGWTRLRNNLSLTPVLLCGFENRNLPILVPQFYVVSINVLLRLALRRLIVSAPELKSVRDAAVRSYNVGSVILHCAPTTTCPISSGAAF